MIFSLHQPRFTIFKLFDRLTLLGAGHTVFHSQASEALPFFESLGLLHDIVFKAYAVSGSVRLSVSPSVAFVHCVEMTQLTVKQFTHYFNLVMPYVVTKF